MSAVSVIIPVYNAARYIGRCLSSLKSQTVSDWEALCIDDGSTDGSGNLLDEYAASDSRIRVIHKPNGGVSEARNAALPLANGEWTLFVDSDDFLHPQTIEICLHLSERDDSDMVCFTYDRAYRTRARVCAYLHLGSPEPFPRKYRPEAVRSITTENIFEYATEYSSSDKGKWAVKHCQPWRCLYKTELIRDILFVPGIIYEDFPWWSEVMLRIGKATICNLPLYYYYPDTHSYIHSAAQERRISSLEKSIQAAENIMKEGATQNQYALWEREFLVPFKDKLARKVRRQAEISSRGQ